MAVEAETGIRIRPRRHRHPVRNALLSVALVAGGVSGAATAYEVFTDKKPAKDPNPKPSVTVPTPPPTITPSPGTETGPTGPDVSPSIEPPVIEQPLSRNYTINGKPAPYGYIWKGDGILAHTTSAVMLGKIVEIDPNARYEYENGYESFTKIKLFLGFDEDGERLYGDFIFAPNGLYSERGVSELKTKELPGIAANEDYHTYTVDEILSKLHEGMEVAFDIPTEIRKHYNAPTPYYRFMSFTKDHHLFYNKWIVDKTPLGEEQTTENPPYSVGFVESVYLRL